MFVLLGKFEFDFSINNRNRIRNSHVCPTNCNNIVFTKKKYFICSIFMQVATFFQKGFSFI
jgi:hypothetical protein